MGTPLRGHRDSVNALHVNGKKLYSASADGSVLEWDLSRLAFSSEPVRRLADCESTVSSIVVVVIKKKVGEKRYLCTGSFDKMVFSLSLH